MNNQLYTLQFYVHTVFTLTCDQFKPILFWMTIKNNNKTLLSIKHQDDISSFFSPRVSWQWANTLFHFYELKKEIFLYITAKICFLFEVCQHVNKWSGDMLRWKMWMLTSRCRAAPRVWSRIKWTWWRSSRFRGLKTQMYHKKYVLNIFTFLREALWVNETINVRREQDVQVTNDAPSMYRLQ